MSNAQRVFAAWFGLLWRHRVAAGICMLFSLVACEYSRADGGGSRAPYAALVKCAIPEAPKDSFGGALLSDEILYCKARSIR